MIYFIQDSRDRSIKIGLSKDPWARLQMLVVAAPNSLSLIAVMEGERSTEKELHARFAHLRVGREWFSDGPDLLEFIAECLLKYPQERRLPTFNQAAADADMAAYWEKAKDPWFLVNLEREYQENMRRKGKDLGEEGKRILENRIKVARFEENIRDMPQQLAELRAEIAGLHAILDRLGFPQAPEVAAPAARSSRP